MRRGVGASLLAGLLLGRQSPAQVFDPLGGEEVRRLQETYQADGQRPEPLLVAFVQDNGCPATLRVYNIWDRAVWRARFSLPYRYSYGDRTERVGYVPYVPARSSTMVRVTCTGYGVRPDVREAAAITMRGAWAVAGVARPLVTSTLELNETAPQERSGWAYTYDLSSGANDPSGLHALTYATADDLPSLASALARTADGLTVIARYVSFRGSRAQWPEASVASLCATNNRAGRTAVWLAAASAPTTASDGSSLAAMIRAACLPRGDAVAALPRAAGVTPTALGGALAAVDDADYPALLAAVGRASGGADAIGRSLQNEPREARLRAGVAALQALSAPNAALRGLLASSQNAATRRELLDVIDRASASSPAWRDDLVTLLNESLDAANDSDAQTTRWLLDAVARAGGDVRDVIQRRLDAQPTIFRADVVSAQLRTPEELAAFFLANRGKLEECRGDVDALLACAEWVRRSYATLAAGGLSPAFLDYVNSQIERPLQEHRAPDGDRRAALRRLALAWRPFGLDTSQVAAQACGLARQLGENAREDEAARVLDFAGDVAPGAACIAESRSWVQGYQRRQTLEVTWRSLAALLPFGLLLVLARRALPGIRDAARSEPAPGGPTGPGGVGPSPERDAARWQRRLASALDGLAGPLERRDDPAAKAVAARLRSLDGPALAALVRECVEAAASTGALSSVLVKQPWGGVYVVAFPGQHDHPQALRRHREFASGWPAHCDAIRAALEGEGVELLTLGLFLHPSDGRVTAVVDDRSDAGTLAPEGLLLPAEAAKGVTLAPEPVTFDVRSED